MEKDFADFGPLNLGDGRHPHTSSPGDYLDFLLDEVESYHKV